MSGCGEWGYADGWCVGRGGRRQDKIEKEQSAVEKQKTEGEGVDCLYW